MCVCVCVCERDVAWYVYLQQTVSIGFVVVGEGSRLSNSYQALGLLGASYTGETFLLASRTQLLKCQSFSFEGDNDSLQNVIWQQEAIS